MIHNSLTEVIGNTPLVKLSKLMDKYNCKGNIIGKCEFMNPMSSVKDRIALSMIEEAEKQGKITKKTVLVEPTSGNTGIGLAFVCAVKGYKLVLTMPESMSIERRKMLSLLGADIELTSATEGMKGSIKKAEEMVKELPDAVMLQQFENLANPKAHRETTVEEIWKDTDGKVDCFIAGVGTGGTITGIGEVLKKRNPDVQIIAVEPKESPVLSGGQAGAHRIQGIGAGFIPKVLNEDVIDETVQITSDKAIETSREAARIEGFPVGISSGAAIAAAIKVAQRDIMEGKNIVVILPSFAERYLSTALFENFIQEL